MASAVSSVSFSVTQIDSKIGDAFDDEFAKNWIETNIFAICSEAYLKTSFSFLGNLLRSVVCTIQFYAAGMLIASPIIWKDRWGILNYLLILTDWSVFDGDSNDAFTQLVLGLIITFLYILFIAICQKYFSINRTYEKWMLHGVRYLYSIILPMICPHYSICSGFLVLEVNRNPSAYNIGFLCAYIASTVFFVALLYVTTLIDDSSILISNTPTACFNVNFRLIFHITTCITSFLQPVLMLFAPWMTLSIIFIHFFLLIYLMYIVYYTPFHKFNMNALYSGLLVIGLVSSILIFIQYIINFKMRWWIVFIIPIVCGIICNFVFQRIFNKKKQKIINALKYSSIPEERTLNLLSKKEHFDTFVFASIHEALQYLYIGLLFHADMFVDFTFVRYMLEEYQKPDIVFAVARISSIFPSELQFLSYILILLNDFKSRHIGEEFMIYQMKRIHVIRQSSVSAEASARLGFIERASSENIAQLRNFWTEISKVSNQISFASLLFLRKQSLKTKSAFLDAINNYPNNSGLLQEYSRFQIECLGDFTGALETGKKLFILEQGRNLVNDYVFSVFVNGYRHYLFNNIVDTKGNFKYNNENISSSLSNSDASSSIDSSRAEIDTRNDAILLQSFNHGKLRMALQKKLKTVSIPSIRLTTGVSIINFTCVIIFYIIIGVLLPKGPETSKEIYSLGLKASDIITSIQYIMCIIGIKFLNVSNGMNVKEYVTTFFDFPPDYFDNQTSLLSNSFLAMVRRSIRLKSIFKRVVVELQTKQFHEEYQIFKENNIFFHVYNRTTNKVGLSFNESQKTLILYFILQSVGMTMYKNESSDLYKGLCNELLLNSIAVSSSFIQLQSYFEVKGKNHIHSIRSRMIVLLIAFVAIIFVLFSLLKGFNIYIIKRDMKYISNILKKVPEVDILESRKPISLKTHKTVFQSAAIHGSRDFDSNFSLHIFESYFSIIATVGILTATIMFFFNQFNNEFKVYEWFTHNSKQYNSALAILNVFFLMITKKLDNSTSKRLINKYLEEANDAHYGLIQSIGESRSFSKFLLTGGTISKTQRNYETIISAMSINSRFNTVLLWFNTLNKTGDEAAWTNGFIKAIYLFNSHLFSDFDLVQIKIHNYGASLYANSMNQMQILIVFGILYSFFSLIMHNLYVKSLKNSLDGVMQLVAMLPPLELLANSALMKFIDQNIKEDDLAIALSSSQIILSTATQACVMFDKNMTIQTINQALKTMTGYLPDQVLGRNISYLFPSKSASNSAEVPQQDVSIDQFYTLIDHLKRSEDEISSSKLTIMKENGETLLVKASVIGVRDLSEEIDMFMIIMSDLTASTQHKKKIKLAKKRVEELFQSILPAQVVPDLRAKKVSQLFLSNIATVLFVEISGYSSYVHMMLPDQLMQGLDLIYSKFHESAEEFPAVHCLKTNDELFVACCGLFDYKEEPDFQVIQAIDYAQKLLEDMDYVNEQLEIALQLKIGINTGGPLVGSVLNSTTPTFDIFGSFISLACRMQADGPEGVIQIGESTYQYIDNKKYDVREGEKMAGSPTYIVNSPI